MKANVLKYGAIVVGILAIGAAEALLGGTGFGGPANDLGWLLLGWAGLRRPGDKA